MAACNSALPTYYLLTKAQCHPNCACGCRTKKPAARPSTAPARKRAQSAKKPQLENSYSAYWRKVRGDSDARDLLSTRREQQRPVSEEEKARREQRRQQQSDWRKALAARDARRRKANKENRRARDLARLEALRWRERELAGQLRDWQAAEHANRREQLTKLANRLLLPLLTQLVDCMVGIKACNTR